MITETHTVVQWVHRPTQSLQNYNGIFAPTVLYVGPVGPNHIAAIHALAQNYNADRETPPPPLQERGARMSVIPQRCRDQHPNDRPEKFDVAPSEMMPQPSEAWLRALRGVDRIRHWPKTTDPWRHWVPEAALFACENRERALRNTKSWVLVRSLWLDRLERDDDRQGKPLTSTEWKTFLKHLSVSDDSPAHVGAVAAHVADVLNGPWPTDRSAAQWQGERVENEHQVREIIWELCDIAFRIELTELDREMDREMDKDRIRMTYRPGQPKWEGEQRRRQLAQVDMQQREWLRGFRIQQVFGTRPLVSHIALEPHAGYASTEIARRASSIEGMRLVVRRWPGAPDRIRCMPPLDSTTPPAQLYHYEHILAEFYCQKFWETAGRAPTVPRIGPAGPDVGAPGSSTQMHAA